MPNSSLRHRHIITGRLASGIGKKPCGTLEKARCSTKNGFSRNLYGEIYHDELDDFSTNQRRIYTFSFD